MQRREAGHLSFDEFEEFDEVINPRHGYCDFDRIVEASINRRSFLGGVLAFGSVAALPVSSQPVMAASSRFSFEEVAASTDDAVSVPPGYKVRVMLRGGDPLFSGAPGFDDATRGTAQSQSRAFGDNVDGMEVFSHAGRTLLVVNNEYTNRDILWGNNPENEPASDDDIAKGMMAHGVRVMEIAHAIDGWEVVTDSPFNRRITPHTSMVLTGPAAGRSLLKTAADPVGMTARGT